MPLVLAPEIEFNLMQWVWSLISSIRKSSPNDSAGRVRQKILMGVRTALRTPMGSQNEPLITISSGSPQDGRDLLLVAGIFRLKLADHRIEWTNQDSVHAVMHVVRQAIDFDVRTKIMDENGRTDDDLVSSSN